MIYRRCDWKVDVADRRQIQCVMFAGHKPLSDDVNHNYGGLGPYTPGMDPKRYVPHSMDMPLWRRLLALVSRWESELEYAKRRAIPSARGRSRWLGERPFSDQHGYDGDDYNDSRYGSPQ